MKLPIKLSLHLALITGIVFSSRLLMAQPDTLHLYYHYTHIKMHDSVAAKIDGWIKKLNGKKVDMDVVAWYDKAETKNYSAQRADELFIVLNRKARSLFNIKTIGPKKGVKSQRATVDIIYTFADAAPAPVVTNQKPDKAKEDKKPNEPKDKKNDVAATKEKKGKDKTEPENKPAKSAEAEEKPNGPVGITISEKDYDTEATVFGGPDARMAGEGTPIKLGQAKQIKQSKIIVAQTSDRQASIDLINAVRNFWNFTGDVSTMTYNKAKDAAKANSKVLILFIGGVSPNEHKHDDNVSGYKSVSSGGAIMIENGKGNLLAAFYIPTFGERADASAESIAFGVSGLNQVLKTMDERQIALSTKTDDAFREMTPKLKQKTLYIPEFWLHTQFDKSEISKIYNSPVEVVSLETWRSAILSKKENVAYVMVTPVPVDGKYILKHYIINAQSGSVYAICGLPGESVYDVSGGYITAKHVDNYNYAIAVGW